MNGHHYEPGRPLVVPPMQHPAPVQFSGDVQRLSLGPGDRLVLKIDVPLEMDTLGRLQLHVAAACGIEPHRVVVLGLGMNLVVQAGTPEGPTE